MLGFRVLAGNKDNLMVVGDDDQSIYGWRGAKIENIQQFTKDFSNASTVRLEQNYRSTANILTAANGLIDQNTGRLGKELWTDMGDGDPIQLYAAYNEIDEARYIVERIKSWSDSGNRREDAAILYRSNAQSRVLEAALLQADIPYRIYGGQRFFERLEVKNALAYLRLMLNCHDDVAFERVVNTPPRGIGGKSVAEIRALARAAEIPLWRAATKILDEGLLTGRARNAISAFLLMIEKLDEQTAEADLGELVEIVVEGNRPKRLPR